MIDPSRFAPFSLSGHSALVTGSTQGVGAAIAIALAQAGADVCLHGLEQDERALETLAACRRFGGRAELILADLTDADENAPRRWMESALGTFPNIDLLVNNAGTYVDIPFLEMTAERYRQTMRLNVDAGFFLTQAFARHWVAKQQAGRILFTGSINGLLAEPTHVAYDASKGAVAAMVRSLCVSLAPLGIRVNSLAPGLVRTPLTDAVLDHDSRLLHWMQLHTPNGVVPKADACGQAAVFLLSDAAAHIHGQTLLVDGGMSCWQQPDPPMNYPG